MGFSSRRFVDGLVKYSVILSLALPLILYPLVLGLNIDVYSRITYNEIGYPLVLHYNVSGSSSTLQFSVLYNGSFTLYIDRDKIEVRELRFNYSITYYVSKKQVNQTLLNKTLIDTVKFTRLFLLSKPRIYDPGIEGVSKLLSGSEKIDIWTGNGYVKHNCLYLDHNVIVILRGMDTVSLPKIGLFTTSIVLVRVREFNGSPPRDLAEYPLSLKIHRYTGVVLEAEYSSSDGLTKINAVLDNYDHPPLRDYMLYSSIYERISDIDYGKHILFNVMLYFVVIAVWSLFVGGFEQREFGRKTRIIMFLTALILLFTPFLLYFGVTCIYVAVLYYLSLMLFIVSLSIYVMEADKYSGYNLLLCGSGLFVVLMYVLLLPVFYNGSLFKIGLENGVVQQNETISSINDLISRGIEPVIVARENLYYSVEGVVAVLLPLLVSSVSSIVGGVLLFVTRRRLLGTLSLTVGISLFSSALLAVKTSFLENALGFPVDKYRYWFTLLGFDYGFNIVSFILVLAQAVIALVFVVKLLLSGG